jgi:hypothetical protein
MAAQTIGALIPTFPLPNLKPTLSPGDNRLFILKGASVGMLESIPEILGTCVASAF